MTPHKTPHVGRPNYLLLGSLATSLATVLVLWLLIPDTVSRLPLVSLMNAYHLVALLLVLVLHLSIACLNLLRPGFSRMSGFALMLLLVFQLRWLQLYTGIGVLALNGDSHWIERAARSANDQEAREYLGVVLRSSRYGANLAENEVLDYPPRIRRRPFSLLAAQAENEHWQEHFQRKAQDAEILP